MPDHSATTWSEATARLRADPAFGPLVDRVGPVRLRSRPPDPFAALASSIVFQQLAGSAARTIHRRFRKALGNEVTPARVVEAPDEPLRAAGLSANKLAAIRDLATRAASGELALEDLDGLDDDEVVERLTRVRGIGTWTAQMFLLFYLERPDVWPTGDLGVRKGLARVLALEEPPSPQEAEWVGIGYRPWRSAVAWYCWKAVDVIPPDVEHSAAADAG